MKISHNRVLVLVLVSFMSLTSVAQDTTILKKINHLFSVEFSKLGLTGIAFVNDTFPTNYVRRGKQFGEMVIRYSYAGKRDSLKVDSQTPVSFRDSKAEVLLNQPTTSNNHPIQLKQAFSLEGDSLSWRFDLVNNGTSDVVIEDWAIPLFFNSRGGENPLEIFERRVAKRGYVAGEGSYLYWQRPSGIGPFLVMTPSFNSAPQFFNVGRFNREQNVYQLFLYASMSVDATKEKIWNRSVTSLTLKPGQRITHGFHFRWAKDYAAMRNILFEEGGFDIRVAPGMTIPRNLTTKLGIRSKEKIDSIVTLIPGAAIVQSATSNNGYRIWNIDFKKLGEVSLKVYTASKRSTQLDFFVTEPLETLYKKRANFIATKQQHRDTSKWYNGLFSQWDMRAGVLRGPDDMDGIVGRLTYVWTCDDPGLCKAPFLAAKNVKFPDQTEIDAIEYYIKNFVWGKLQRTDQETPYPYGVYGTPNWLVNRNADLRKQNTVDRNQDKMHVWRSYDYPHIMMMYYHMYQIASYYPDKVKYADKKEYLKRAVETAKAYFKYPYEILPWYETYKWGCYNELLLPELMDVMRKEGYSADADWLKQEWEKKVKYFIYDDPYPFRSEYAVDATAYESTHMFAKYALQKKLQSDSNLWYDKNLKKWYSHPQINELEHERFMEKQMRANLASRGVLEPAYYYMGSDFRGSNDGYLLSYMAQMGGWAVLDYGLNHSSNASDYLQLGYASYLSSFALVNTGDVSSNYGYWFPGKQNDGAAGWAYEPKLSGNIWIGKQQARGPWMYDGEIDLGFGGALRSAATIITNDPIFGWIAYGGKLTRRQNIFSVIPQDGIRQKIYLRGGDYKIDLELNRDGFLSEQAVSIDPVAGIIECNIENRTGIPHSIEVDVKGLPQGQYQLIAGTSKPQLVEVKENGIPTKLTFQIIGKQMTLRFKKQ